VSRVVVLLAATLVKPKIVNGGNQSSLLPGGDCTEIVIINNGTNHCEMSAGASLTRGQLCMPAEVDRMC
jgi:hypothetical protein